MASEETAENMLLIKFSYRVSKLAVNTDPDGCGLTCFCSRLIVNLELPRKLHFQWTHLFLEA